MTVDSVEREIPLSETPAQRLSLAHARRLDVGRAAAILSRPQQAWLGPSIDAASGRPGQRCFEADLRLPLRGRRASVTLRKVALVELGPLLRTPQGCLVDVSWRSANLAPLFPVFAGCLLVTADGITLEGFYAPPGGTIGLALDRAFLNIAARETARAFVDAVAAELAGYFAEGGAEE